MDGMLPGLALPVALVGIAEKGYASVALTVEGRAGHSSMPPPHTAIGVLARAIARLEQRPMATRMAMPRLMFQELGAFLPFTTRLALANPFFFGRTVEKRLLASPQTAALARTTIAATMIEGGVKDNILPARACAVINCRLMPGDTRAALVEHIRRAVDDEAVQVALSEENGWEASPVSPVDGPAYQSLVQTIRQAFPDAVAAPYLVSGATDARYYAALSPAVYRFSPYLLDASLLKTIHGVDERVRIEDLGRMVGFYKGLIQAWAG
jgi:carboxypeptidase PM20D1